MSDELTMKTDGNTSDKVRQDPGGTWHLSGLLIGFCGFVGFVLGILMPVTVSANFGSELDSEVVNLGLLFNKAATLATSLAAIGIGVFCLAVAAILNTITLDR